MSRKDFSGVRPRMTHFESGFCSFRDNQEVEQFGFINLNECLDKGIVPGGVDLTDESFNGVQNPGTLISRSSDIFDGLRKREYVERMLSTLNAEEREKAENALNRQASKEGVSAALVSSEG